MCTNFKLKSEDQSIIVGRTMEFGFDLKSQFLVFPRNFTFTAHAPEGMTPLRWQSTYGFVALNAFGLQMASDGLMKRDFM